MSEQKRPLPDVVEPLAPPTSPAAPYASPPPALPPLLEEQAGGLSLKRYLRALYRFKWIILAAGVVGVACGVAVASKVSPRYVAEGNLWVLTDDESAGGPIRESSLFQASAWIALLRSYAVLDSVVIGERLYIQAQREVWRALEGFSVAGPPRPGNYTFQVDADGSWTLLGGEGLGGDGKVLDQGEAGTPVGEEIGFEWTPSPTVAAPGAQITFSLVTIRDAALALSQQLQTDMDAQGNFIGLALVGTDPVRIASVLNAVMERHVRVAADLKRTKLAQREAIVEEQLRYAQAELENAERELEDFRVRTITMPSDQAAPIAAGLDVTRGSVFTSYFSQKVELDQVRSQRARLGALMAAAPDSGVSVEGLEAIPAVVGSSQLKLVLAELVEARAALRTMRDRYEDDYPPLRDLLERIQRLESLTIPSLTAALDHQLALKEADLASRVEAASAELANIPPRSIEEARLRRQVAIQEGLYNELRGRYEVAGLAAASSVPDVQILDAARVPESPTLDQRLRLFLMVVAGFLGAGMLAAILLDRGDVIVRDAIEVGSDMGIDVLGAIPTVKVGKRANPDQVLEAFRGLRLNVDYAYGRAGPMVLTVSSPDRGEGKTLVSTNLAVAFANMGRRTLLVDGDTRLGDAHAGLGLDRKPGLTDYLARHAGREIVQETRVPNLYFVGSGSRSASSPELVATERMSALVGALKRAYQVIIIDSPPLSAGGDAIALSAMTGSLALVIRGGSTNRELAHAKLEALQRFPVRLLGVILNGFPERGSARYKYYSNYLDGYGARSEPDVEGQVEEAPHLRVIAGSTAV